MLLNRPRYSTLWIAIGCLALYAINFRTIAEVDCDVAPYAAWSLVSHGSLDISAYPMPRGLSGGLVVPTRDGGLVSKYPPGSAFAAVPFVAPFAILSQDPPTRRSPMRRLGKAIAACYVAATVVLIHLLCRLLAPEGAWPATLLAAAGSMLWSTASQGYWAHAPAAFFVALALYLLLRARPGPGAPLALAAGLSLGMAVMTRPTTGLFAVAAILALALGRRLRAAVALAFGVALLGSLLVVYNQHAFGSPLAGGYGAEARAWSTPLHVGLTGLLVAPSRGLLIYMPALLLLPLAWGAMRRRGALSPHAWNTLVAWLGAAGATLLAYSKWHTWWGGWCFGPRFLIETLPVLLAVFALAWQEVGRRWGRRALHLAWALVWLSLAIHFVGVFGYHVAWMASHEGPEMFGLADTQIAARARTLLERRPWALALPALAAASVLAAHVRARRARVLGS